jgi:acetyl esterase
VTPDETSEPGAMTEPLVLVDHEGWVRTLTLNRPTALNAFNQALCDALADALVDADRDDDVHVVVLTGTGRAFSAGTDLYELADTGDFRTGPGAVHGFEGLIDCVTGLTKPLICAVNGFAVGIGATILGHADLVLASSAARLRCPFTSLALVPEAGASLTFPLLMGRQAASWFLMSSEWIDARDAQDAGLVWRVVDPEQLLPVTMKHAHLLASWPLASLVESKRLISTAFADLITAARHREGQAFDRLLGAPPNRRALAAFAARTRGPRASHDDADRWPSRALPAASSLDPSIRQFLADSTAALDSFAGLNLDLAELRARSDHAATTMHRRVAQPGPAVASVTDHLVPVEGGTILVRIYTPPGPGPHPAHVLLHGGGWWHGSIEDWIIDVQARERCVGAQCVVVTVDYRLAPEHPFPIPAEDCYTALCWLADNASQLEVNPTKLSMGGSSAGANLAAAASLMARDRGHPGLILQLLEVLAADHSRDHDSVRQFNHLGPDLETLTHITAMYLPNPGDAQHPYAAPLLAPDLSGLPPAYIATAELDPLRDGAELYARRLNEANVSVTAVRHRGHIHTSPVMTAHLGSARRWRDGVLAVLRAANHAQISRTSPADTLEVHVR